MSSTRVLMRASRLAAHYSVRPFTTTHTRLDLLSDLNKRGNDTADAYRKFQIEKPTNPHMTNTNSTIANEMPSIGKDSPPPELITSADPNFTPKDSHPENTERMTGGTQAPAPENGKNADLNVGGQKQDMKVGEIEGGTFRVEPLRRTGEDANTMRARLLYQSRKRGTLESDLLLSTFADANLARMSPEQLQQYDLFLDENDWDIYYWVTQEPTPTSMAYAEGAGPGFASPEAQGTTQKGDGKKEEKAPVAPSSGEWAQTVGTFKPAYRPVPARWKSSEILAMLRKHVISRSAGGVHVATGDSMAVSKEGQGQGMQFMPALKNFDT